MTLELHIYPISINPDVKAKTVKLLEENIEENAWNRQKWLK